ncbi:TrbI/VirB10 family protein [Burkholderia pseudomallei]|uniref:TrbI/VirB10 family protein n=1 Tax=Burkholderia pseudomallei TaxID=28450 RepID=UPI00053924B8|nr:TrbI/VirB10 family protein [Burkholderia pseudomallei]KGX19038.1 bacterial conjugation TrbI-like family protein [Burkholderia pseudomallei ABCPW 1]
MIDLGSGAAESSGQDVVPPPGERGIPSLTGKKRTRVNRLVIVAVVVAMLLLSVLAISIVIKRFTDQKTAERAAALAKPKEMAAPDQSDLESAKKRIKADEDAKAAKAAAASAAAASMPVPAGASAVQVPPVNAQPVGVVATNGRSTAATGPGPAKAGEFKGWFSGVLLDTAGKSGSSGGASAGPASGQGTPSAASSGSGRNSLDEQLAPSATSRAATVSAAFLPDLSYLLKHGTLIPCVGPKIVTTYPGMLSCTLMQDVYSANGRTLLLRKGATATAEQRTALLQGQARIFALFTSIDDGPVTVNLDSPATDPLGGSGIEAWTDTHFWTRFGGALMVGMISDFGQAFANRTQNSGSGTTISLSNTSQATQSLATETLRNTINIPPTGYSNQGTVIYIYVARNVDFRSVYELTKG